MDSTPSIILKPKSVHFLACVHGMWGAPEHLKTVEDTIRQKFADTEGDTELVTLRIRTNAESNTYDGLDWGAERAVKEIYAMIEELESDGLKKVTKFSIFGYSLGGLISRYTIGILYQRGFFHNVKPVNFTTFATPHLGLPRFRGFIGATMHKLGPIMLSRTGRQFYGTDDDKWSPDAKEGRPLLEVMADKESIFFKALMSFPNVTFYGNAVHDLTVTYCTALAEAHDPFTVLKSKSHRLAIKLDPQYKHVIQSFSEVPTGEPVPLTDIEREHKEQRAAIPWYSPTRYQSSRQGLPPFLQFPFPFNLVLYCLLPALIPAGLLYATVRFRRESHESQLRLKALADSPDAESSLGAIMRRMEMAVADIVDPADPGVASESDMEEGALVTEGKRDDETRKRKAGRPHTPDAEDTAGSLPTPLPTPSSAPTTDPIQTSFHSSSKRKSRKSVPKSDREDPDQPVLTPAQLAMIDSLNSIPQLKKVLAYFPYVRNAHSVIIVRDPETFPIHRDGMGVVNHWADRFVL